MPAWAVGGKNWSIDYETSLEGTTNLQQQTAGGADFVLRNSLELSYFPAADADNSALFRIQALNQRYRLNPDYDSTFLVGTALASRRIVDSIFGYGGYQLILKQSNAPSNISRQDNDIFAGIVQYKPLSPSQLVFHGYQLDYLRAAVSETSYMGHSAYLTYRDLTTDRWSNSVSARMQLRLYDTIGEIDFRNQLTAESSYRVMDWWSIQAEAFYVNSTSTNPGFSFNALNFGLFSRFSL